MFSGTKFKYPDKPDDKYYTKRKTRIYDFDFTWYFHCRLFALKDPNVVVVSLVLFPTVIDYLDCSNLLFMN